MNIFDLKICKFGNVVCLQNVLENDFSLSDDQKNELIKCQGSLSLGPLSSPSAKVKVEDIVSYMIAFGDIGHVEICDKSYATLIFNDSRSNLEAVIYFDKQVKYLFLH